MKVYSFLFLIGLLLTAACKPTNMPPIPVEHAAYVLSGSNVANGFRNNALTIVNNLNWKVERQVALPRSWAKNPSRDPQGRLWIGFSGNGIESDNRVVIYSEQGEELKTLRPCIDPEAGISFSAGYAFIACAEDGFRGKVAVINLSTLTIQKAIEIGNQEGNLLLISSAADADNVIVCGLTSGPQDKSNIIATVIDSKTLTVKSQTNLGENTDVWRIIPNQGQFYLLNVGGWRQIREEAKDVLVLNPSLPTQVTTLNVSPSPLWGTVDGDSLYLYHNPTWNQTNSDIRRKLSQVNLSNKQVKTWDLPNNWDASDLVVINGLIILVRWTEKNDAEDGLYQFNPTNGSLTLLSGVADASAVIMLR